MDDNPYAAPQSYGEEVRRDAPLPEFYVVSIRKFYLLFLLTLGLYGVYWNYRHWAAHKRKNRADLWPIPRGVFAVFFTHALFNEVDVVNRRRSSPIEWNAGTWATQIVVILLATGLLNWLSGRSIGSPVTDALSLLCLPPTAILYAKAQRVINTICDDRDGESNRRITPWNLLWIIAGSVLTFLVVLGSFFPTFFL